MNFQVDEHHIMDVPESSFVDFQTRMVTNAKEIARLAQEMVCIDSTLCSVMRFLHLQC